jgi:hypothetical protein
MCGMKNVALALILLVLAPYASAADEMQKLDWLIGEWKGEAWVKIGAKTDRAVQTERVQAKLGGKVLLIEGVGRRKLEDGSAGEIMHDALALVSWDEVKKTYRFSAYTFNHPATETTLDVTAPNTAVWGMETPQGRIRYTLHLTDKGEWSEVGDFSRDGKQWVRFFEMTLTKVK